MANKYKINPETFTYHSDNKAVKISKIILTQMVAIVFLSIAIFYGLSFFTDSEQERTLKYENKMLHQQYNQIFAQYKQNEKDLKILEQQDKGLYQIIFGTTQQVDSSDNIFNSLIDEKPKVIVRNNSKELNETIAYLKDTKQDYINFIDSLKETITNSENIPSIQPVPNPNLQLLINGYGYRLDPIYHTPHFHKGIDFSVPIGTPVIATANGIVQKAGRGTKEQGNLIEITNDDYTTRYLHLDEVKVRRGQHIKQGELIGYAGTSGKSLVPHLHYEILYNDEPINPIFFFFMDLSASDFNIIYKKSVTAGISLD